MVEKVAQYQKEFHNAISDIMSLGCKVENAYERVRIVQWIRRLCALRNDVLEEVRIKNEYAQYLRVCLKLETKVLPKPFSSSPPKTVVVPLAECLGNMTADQCQNVPRTGRLQPIICHKSEDNRAFINVKRCPDGGVLCYMGVAPNALAPPPCAPDGPKMTC